MCRQRGQGSCVQRNSSRRPSVADRGEASTASARRCQSVLAAAGSTRTTTRSTRRSRSATRALAGSRSEAETRAARGSRKRRTDRLRDVSLGNSFAHTEHAFRHLKLCDSGAFQGSLADPRAPWEFAVIKMRGPKPNGSDKPRPSKVQLPPRARPTGMRSVRSARRSAGCARSGDSHSATSAS